MSSMRIKIVLLTLASGTAALVLAQQTQYTPTAPGNPNAPAYPPNNVVTTQSVSPQNISPQNIGPQNLGTNSATMGTTNGANRNHGKNQE